MVSSPPHQFATKLQSTHLHVWKRIVHIMIWLNSKCSYCYQCLRQIIISYQKVYTKYLSYLEIIVQTESQHGIKTRYRFLFVYVWIVLRKLCWLSPQERARHTSFFISRVTIMMKNALTNNKLIKSLHNLDYELQLYIIIVNPYRQSVVQIMQSLWIMWINLIN